MHRTFMVRSPDRTSYKVIGTFSRWSELHEKLAEAQVGDLWFWIVKGREQGECWLTQASLRQCGATVKLRLQKPPQLHLTAWLQLAPTSKTWEWWGAPHELRSKLEELKRKLLELEPDCEEEGFEDVEWQEHIRQQVVLEGLTQKGSVVLDLKHPVLPVSSVDGLALGRDWLPVRRWLGRGGFACVWQARRREEDVAVKVARGGRERENRHEIEVLQGLQPLRHPCIVRLLGCLEVQGRPAYLMPLAHCSLANLLEDEKWSPWWDPAAQELMGYEMENSVLSALFQLQAASSLPKLLHQDIKAENVLVTHAPGSASHLGLVLADWGCAAREGSTAGDHAGLASSSSANENCSHGQRGHRMAHADTVAR